MLLFTGLPAHQKWLCRGRSSFSEENGVRGGAPLPSGGSFAPGVPNWNDEDASFHGNAALLLY